MSAPDAGQRRSDGELAATERRVVSAAATGGLVDLRAGDAATDNPANGPGWGAERTVPADLLAELLTGQRTPEGGRLRSVKLRGARISGTLDLEAADLVCPLLLAGCYFDAPVNLGQATAPAIRMPGCRLPGLAADQMQTTGNLELNRGFTANGQVCLAGAHIGGILDLDGATAINPDGYALRAPGLTVAGEMTCEKLTAEGEIHLQGARIGGGLSFLGAALTNPGGYALRADGASVTGDLDCRGGLIAEGEVHLIGAHIGGTLYLDGARLSNPGGRALAADRLTVGQLTYCRDGFMAEGLASLAGAHLGHLNLAGATLTNPGGRALFADRLIVDVDMYCWKGFTANGEVRLPGARIGNLSFWQGRLASPGGVALDLQAATVGTLTLLPRQPPDGIVDLTNVKAGVFRDDQATWPATMRLQGFTYDSLGTSSIPVRARLRWLARHPGDYIPQIYDQLAAAYRRAGREDAARQVAIAKQRHRRSVLGPVGRLLNWLLEVTVGYGYRTWLAGIWLVTFLITGSAVFSNVQMAATIAHPGAFHPLGYTIDVLVPFADLGLKNDWQPSGGYLYLAWVLRGIGWVLTTAVVAVLTGVVKRD